MNAIAEWALLIMLAIAVALFARWLWFEIQKEAVIIEAEEIKDAATD